MPIRKNDAPNAENGGTDDLELIVNKAYSYQELLDRGYELVRFHSGFSLYSDGVDMYLFKHYKPPEDQPAHKFYFKGTIEMGKYLKNEE